MKKYIEVYKYFKNIIENNQLKYGDRLPSIRVASELLNVSKTTIQNAYFELQADGYIIANPKSGYYVSMQESEKSIAYKNDVKASPIIYDLKSGDADKDSFDIKLWQRYIKSALRQQDRLLSYGDVQGEIDLREVLSEYIRTKRNVIASPDRIVVGAGVQSLLNILCSLLKKEQTVSFPDDSFIQGISLFEDYGFNVKTRYKDANIIYVCPSHMTSYGNVMSIKRRLELLKYSAKNNSLVIEDDYDSDFMYQSKPTPSLFALSNTDNVIYMGSFSNVLIPGIRISFMILTKELANVFELNKHKFAQTASKTEQIALCQYIRDGHINYQTRKVRRHYITKTKLLYDSLRSKISNANIHISDNGLQVMVETKFSQDENIFENNGVAVNIVSHTNDNIKLSLTPSSLKEDELDTVSDIISSILNQ